MSFFKPISDQVHFLQEIFASYHTPMKLVFTSILGCLATLLQAAGGFLPGIGYLVSPLATAPILLGSLVSIHYGIMSFLLTNTLLLIIEPTELIIFPFTTGLLELKIVKRLVNLFT